MTTTGPVLALDVGTRTIGLAVTDPGRSFVFPVSTLARRSVAKDVEQLARVCRERRVTALVLGIAVDDEGRLGRSARLARQVGDALVAATGLPLAEVDEGYTTVEAHTRLQAAGVRAADRRPMVDQEAAVVILELWLAAGRPEVPGTSGPARE